MLAPSRPVPRATALRLAARLHARLPARRPSLALERGRLPFRPARTAYPRRTPAPHPGASVTARSAVLKRYARLLGAAPRLSLFAQLLIAKDPQL